jgi:hypothetical protein
MILKIRTNMTAIWRWIRRTLGNVNRLGPIFTQFRQQTGSAWRSSALHPLLMMLGLLLGCAAIAAVAHELIVACCILACVAPLLFFACKVYWKFATTPELSHMLRSERFNAYIATVDRFGDSDTPAIARTAFSALDGGEGKAQ